MAGVDISFEDLPSLNYKSNDNEMAQSILTKSVTGLEKTESHESRARVINWNVNNSRIKTDGSIVSFGKVLLNKIATFFGIRDNESDMQLWKNKITARAKNGQLGITAKDIIPISIDCKSNQHHPSDRISIDNIIEMEIQSPTKKIINQESSPLLPNSLNNGSDILSSINRSESDSSVNKTSLLNKTSFSILSLPKNNEECRKPFYPTNHSRNSHILRNNNCESDADSESEVFPPPFKSPKIPGVEHFKFIDEPARRLSSRSSALTISRNKECKRKPFIPISGEVTSRMLSNTTLELQAEPVNLTASYRSRSQEVLNKSKSEEDLEAHSHLFSLKSGGSYRELQNIEHEDKMQEMGVDINDEPQKYTKAWFLHPVNYFFPRSSSIWKRFHSEEQIISKIKELQFFTPWFIYIISFVQAVVLIVICSVGSFVSTGLSPHITYQNAMVDFKTENLKYLNPFNMWFGPSTSYLITAGAIYSPCMRLDNKVRFHLSEKDYQFNLSAPLGCCEVGSKNAAGSLTEAECQKINKSFGDFKWINVTCSKRLPGENSKAHLLKPCCLPLNGQCILVSQKTCDFLNGKYYVSRIEHCREVNCLNFVCGFGGLSTDPNIPYFPERSYQWWRILIAPFIPCGIMYFFIMGIIQWISGIPIEKMAGSLRTALIYIFSSIGGNMFAVLINPYSIQVGYGSAVCGLIGVWSVELIQCYKLLRHPIHELVKLITIIILICILGLFPTTDNASHLGGFIFGIFLAILLLPYITFNQWQVKRRQILIGLTIPLLLFLFLTEFILFYQVQILGKCSSCNYFNCVPLKENMCLYSWNLLDKMYNMY